MLWLKLRTVFKGVTCTLPIDNKRRWSCTVGTWWIRLLAHQCSFLLQTSKFQKTWIVFLLTIGVGLGREIRDLDGLLQAFYNKAICFVSLSIFAKLHFFNTIIKIILVSFFSQMFLSFWMQCIRNVYIIIQQKYYNLSKKILKAISVPIAWEQWRMASWKFPLVSARTQWSMRSSDAW